ncbi:glycogen debranching protein GlgX [Acidocella sp.]|uniref:glycogen debranching protein GlgX n=1 Tax=Acidocella sp. TaxID=50710 RepID=UPI00260B6C28|nr:glycogen debranching protein GlgX [Acidocella sp.]
MPHMPTKLQTGKPYPIGAHWDGLGVNFAVFSAHAERVELCLFDPGGQRQIARLDLPDCTDEVFHGYLPQAAPGLVYGYRVHGPYQPEAGHRFNPNKLLLDPYAKKTIGRLHWSDALFGYRVGSSRADLSFDRRDSAMAMPKAVVVDDSYGWGDDTHPARPWSDTVIYETHIRGMTILNEAVPQLDRGSFIALGDPYIIDHLVKLGITTVELLPAHAFLQDRFLVTKNLSNYWGYSTLSFFAPESAYLKSSRGSLDEIRQTVQRLHAADIEVILDVVYNHTCEGSEMGTTLSWRGFDNASYYRGIQDQPRRLVNDTGTGNTLNITHPRVLQMVLDSLRYWVQAYHVDGFRFDLGSTLGRESYGFDRDSGFFDAIRQDPVLSRMKLISEPWDIGPGGYQLGNHPPGFSEWNDRFRDGVRRFWRGDSGQRPELAARLMGSSDFFEKFRRKTRASINFIAAHDGFTLNDTVSYNERHNEANGEDNNDGHGENLSNNWGAEGLTEDAGIIGIRETVKRSLLATLFFSHGTPMLLGGDEMGRSQQGNNNAYCQDNEISWFNWAELQDASETPAKSLFRFTARLAELRRQHPSLRAENFMHGGVEVSLGLSDTAWFDEQGAELTDDSWANATAQLLALRRAVSTGHIVDVTYLALNASHDDRDYVLPNLELEWTLSLDTANPSLIPEKVTSMEITVAAHGAVLLTARVKL